MKEYMDETQLSKNKLANHLGLTMKQVELLLIGTLKMNAHIAEKLSKLLETSSQLWLDLQKNYTK